MSELIEKVKRKLGRRKSAYEQVFGGYGAPELVLADLAKFCRAGETTFRKDPRESDLLTGRHEVWLRIQQHLNLTDEQLFNLYSKGNINE